MGILKGGQKEEGICKDDDEEEPISEPSAEGDKIEDTLKPIETFHNVQFIDHKKTDESHSFYSNTIEENTWNKEKNPETHSHSNAVHEESKSEKTSDNRSEFQENKAEDTTSVSSQKNNPLN